jgi:nitroreductase
MLFSGAFRPAVGIMRRIQRSGTMTSRVTQPSVQDFPHIYPVQEQLRFLLRYAILAPSTRNTQPWRFAVDGNQIMVQADLSRAQPVADDDRRELYLSLGCAIENLLVAAEQFGFRHSIAYLPRYPDERVAAAITLLPGGHRTAKRGGLSLQTILSRQTAHGRFSDRPISDDDVLAFRRCVTEPELEFTLLVDPERRREVEDIHRTAHETALADPAFRHELAEWVGAGAFGTPWPLSRIGQAVIGSELMAHQLARLDAIAVGSAPMLGLISSRDDDRPSQIRSGQLLERLWLTATARGLGLQPLSAALEVPNLRLELTRVMDARCPWAQQLVRIGHPRGGSAHRTPRRPLDGLIDPPGSEP